jgi:hypothetical protein
MIESDLESAHDTSRHACTGLMLALLSGEGARLALVPAFRSLRAQVEARLASHMDGPDEHVEISLAALTSSACDASHATLLLGHMPPDVAQPSHREADGGAPGSTVYRFDMDAVRGRWPHG